MRSIIKSTFTALAITGCAVALSVSAKAATIELFGEITSVTSGAFSIGDEFSLEYEVASTRLNLGFPVATFGGVVSSVGFSPNDPSSSSLRITFLGGNDNSFRTIAQDAGSTYRFDFDWVDTEGAVLIDQGTSSGTYRNLITALNQGDLTQRANIFAQDGVGEIGLFFNLATFNGEALGAPPITAVPLPAALPLLAGVLGLFGLVGWRRNRRL